MASLTRGSDLSLRSRTRYWLLPALVLAVSCRSGEPTGVLRAAGGSSAAKGGGSGGSGGTTTLAVTSASPAQAPQDTTLDVTITGSGFTTGAKAAWALNGDTTLVHVQSTKVVSSTQLVAHVQVPGTAPVASYDVQVTLTSGKKGVGAEMFTVTPSDPNAEFLFPLDATGLGIASDGQFVSGDQSVYAFGVCGVTATIFATTARSNSGDATMQTNNPAYKDHRCASYPRKLLIDYGDGTTPQWSTVFINLSDLQRDNDPADQIPVGASRLRALHIQETRCSRLQWSTKLRDGTLTDADSVVVTRVSEDTWQVSTQPAPNDKAYCDGDGKLYHIPVHLTVVRLLP
jgi:hypothetical protein